MQVNTNSTNGVAPPLTVVVRDHRGEALVPNRKLFRILHRPGRRTAEHARNVFVLVPATELPQVAKFVAAVNRRNQLRALLIREDVEPSAIPQMFERAHLRLVRNTVVHSSDDRVPMRLLTAWAHNAQDELIAKAVVGEDRLFVLSCSLQPYEIAFHEMPALERIPKADRAKFNVAADGSFIHWPGPDIHIDLDAIRAARDPGARAKALAFKARHDARYGAAIATLRISKGLKQSDIKGLSERQVRRIEKGGGTTSKALRLLAASHHMKLDEYLREVAEGSSGAGRKR